MEQKKTFAEHLFTQMAALASSYYGLVITTTATILLLYGWMLTSEHAQKLIASSKTIIILLSSGLFGAWLTLLLTDIDLAKRSKTISRLIRGLNYYPSEDYYNFREITISRVIGMKAAHLILILIFIALIINIRKKKKQIPLEKEAD